MFPKNAVIAAFCTGLLAFGGPAIGDDYRPDEYLGLDLSKALLSPKRLGPPAEFVPVPIEAKADSAGEAPQARAEPPATRQIVVQMSKTKARHAERRAPARAKLAKRPGNPLDAQARDIRVQVWPCRSGGICNWR